MMFMMPVHPPGRPMWSTFEEDAEKSVLADQLGFDEVGLGEHFTATAEPFPSAMMFFAALLPRTKTITFGTTVINIPGIGKSFRRESQDGPSARCNQVFELAPDGASAAGIPGRLIA